MRGMNSAGNGWGTNMSKRQLRVVKLLEPEMCLECRFGHRAEVEMNDGSLQQMIYCKRLDCDNWDYSSAEPAKSVNVQDFDSDAA